MDPSHLTQKSQEALHDAQTKAHPDLLEAGVLRTGLVRGVRINSRQGAWVNGLDTAQRSTAPHATRFHVIDVTQMS